MFDFLEKTYDSLENDKNKLKKSIFGGIAMIGSILILPAIIYQGYIIRILKQTGKDDNIELPKWNDIDVLFKDGLIAFTVILLLSLIWIIPYMFMILFEEQAIIFLILAILTLILSTLISYITNGILTVGFRDGFSEVMNMDRMLSLFISMEYIIGIIAIIGINIIFSFIIFFLLFTIIGIPLIFILIPLRDYIVAMVIGNAITQAENNDDDIDNDD